ncbi:hypothetical protein A5717_26215 [Mycolicibacterium porcinum]|uniref:hypothetical protein n=1 Tax=Mycolicibacterium porcinum TaxID=39693 RepID=UPI00080B0666|nr:hypothetical protein [Mycolicibacterium porcinum]OCB09271.1 hypothetical protein A5717_26215 [Mycolicibacterium porcinum]
MIQPTIVIELIKLVGIRKFPGRKPEQPYRYMVRDAGNHEAFERPTERYSEARGALHAIDQVHGPDAVVALRVPGKDDVIIRAPKDVYPHMSTSGEHIVLGPQCFAAADGSVINWKGTNYIPQDQA